MKKLLFIFLFLSFISINSIASEGEVWIDGVQQISGNSPFNYGNTIVSVEHDYGAVCDGSTDDTTAFQNAIDGVSALGGGTVFVPPNAPDGCVILGVEIKDNVRLTGAGIGISILKGKNEDVNTSMIEGLDGSTGDPYENITIDNLTLDGSTMNVPGVYSAARKNIYIQYMRNSLFHSLYMNDAPATCLGIDYLVNVVIDRVIVDGCGTAGQVLGSNGIGIGTGRFASSDEPVVISNSIARNVSHAGIMYEEQSGSSNEAQGLVIANSIAYNNQIGFEIAGVQKVAISGVVARANNTDGLIIMTSPLDTGEINRDINISGSIFDANGDEGIEIINHSTRVSINGNQISLNGDYGLILRCERCNVIGNTIYANTTDGILVDNDDTNVVKDIVISGNEITGNKDGIEVKPDTANMSNISIVGNMFTSNTQYGIRINGDVGAFSIAGLSIIGNHFNSNTSGALSVTDTGGTDYYYSKNFGLIDSRTIADSGDGSPATLSFVPISDDVRFTCNDSDTCDITLNETNPSIKDGMMFNFINVSSNTVYFSDSSGVTELSGASALDQYDSIDLKRISDRFVEKSRSNN